MGPRIIELIRSEVLILFMFVDNSRDSRETRTHKLENTEKYWLEYYRPGRSHNFSFSNQDNLINVGQFLYFQIILTTTGHNHHQLS